MARAAGLATLATIGMLVQPVSGQTRWSYPRCASASDVNSYGIGDAVPLCITLNGNITAMFNPRLDVFSALLMTGSNFALPAGTGFVREGFGWVDDDNATAGNCTFGDSSARTLYVTFDVSSWEARSDNPRVYKRIRYDPCVSSNNAVDTLSIHTVIVGMSMGRVEFIAFDDGCVFCASNGADCLRNSLAVNESNVIDNAALTSCRQDSATCYSQPLSSNATLTNGTGNGTVSIPSSPCDFRLFVVWTGTDRSGQFLRSAGQRFSRYRQFGTATLQQSTVNIAGATVQIGRSALDSATAIPGAVIPGNARTLHAVDAEPQQAAPETMTWVNPAVRKPV